MQIAIKDINIGKRYRQKVGDLADLKASMERLGLLQPIGVSTDKRLIFGQRRVEAARQLGWAVIECRVVDLEDPLAAERDENECRADFTLSEKVAIGKAIEEREKAKAAERSRAGKPIGETTPLVKGKKSHDGNGAAPKPGKPVFDDRPFPKLFGQLVRFIDNRKRAMGAGPAGEGHAECRDALGAVLAAWKRWQRVTT
jgi:hypothetical protein